MDSNITFSTKKLIQYGMGVIILAIGGFVLWASLVKVDAAAVASGTLVVESQRKKIQHLHGGQVKQILVEEGQSVTKGQTLIALADHQVESNYQRVLLKVLNAQAQIDRLTALLNNVDELIFSGSLLEYQHRLEVVQLMAMQSLMFERQQSDDDHVKQQFDFKKRQLAHSLEGIDLEIKSIKKQLGLVREEVRMNEVLLTDGYVSKSRHLSIQRTESSIEATLIQLHAKQAITLAQLGEIEHGYDSHYDQSQQKLAEHIQKQRLSRDEALQLLAAHTETRQHINITAEHSGIIVAMTVHSIGAVILPGQVVMELVPDSDTIIVEAYVKPEDIDVVHSGLSAQVRLTAYDGRNVAPIKGEIIHVSADRFFGLSGKETDGYLVKVRLDSARMLDKAIKLHPGMSADVYIVLAPRTLLQYLLSPLSNSFNLSFRES
ncbi:HlyD family type I secretion periplasmic adaptor subunit [Shewanella surugensis]|uniref:Membrane fusion protein (MFP) family protein n=1 Tax=Shewanella surugensis TaxID=212020 RepID=A0ABT0LC23_9GAMM|nr:HlyD family type I secretion periplasmic adaptor subunit [Shewanella surugensis]MCL1125254.1 HlyD family type I secretion periplasmic adaptor subunit [Shewanella surugensis]